MRHVGGCRTVCMGVTSLQLFFLNQGVSIACSSHPLATFITTSPSIFSPRLFGHPTPTHPPPRPPDPEEKMFTSHSTWSEFSSLDRLFTGYGKDGFFYRRLQGFLCLKGAQACDIRRRVFLNNPNLYKYDVLKLRNSISL
jgi:hypothetical protein